MPNLGVHVREQATAVTTPDVAESGIPFVVGLAPVHTAAKPAPANVPVLCTSWKEAVEKLGFSEDWAAYTLCEFMDSHFKLYGCQPVIFCNVLDPGTMKQDAAAKSYPVTDHKLTLPLATLADTLELTSGETALARDEDYAVLYNENSCIVELLRTGAAYGATELTVSAKEVTPESVTDTEIAAGLDAVDACMNRAGCIPDLICAPGFSHKPAIAALMAVKAENINGLFGGKALVDADCGAGGVRKAADLSDYKAQNRITDDSQILCWPMATREKRRYHMSTHLAGLMAQVDAGNGGIPYESPSNKPFQIDGCCLEDGTEVDLTFQDTNDLAGCGVVTAFHFLDMGWTCRNSYTACYPGNTDVKDCFIPVSRMFKWVGNSIVRSFWRRLDKPMTRLLVDSVVDACNIWLNGLVGAGYLLGARAEFPEDENPLADLMQGILRIHVYLTPPAPAQEFDFTLEYDAAYVAAALAA
ncbi:MAG: phage tail protein [Oscillospiraceae bacterium]|nr:phage tail protein [Oscillospiraceae bacterium]